MTWSSGQTGDAHASSRGIDAADGGEHVVDQAAGRGEGDAGADAVAGLAGAEHGRQPLGEPPLDALRGDGDDLLGEGVRQRAGQQIRQAGREQRGPLGPVDVEHLACIADGPALASGVRRGASGPLTAIAPRGRQSAQLVQPQ